MEKTPARRRFLVQSAEAAIAFSSLGSGLLSSCKSTGRGQDLGELSGGEIQNPSYKADDVSKAKSIRMSATDPQNARNVQLYSKAVEKMKATEFPLPVNGEKLTWWEAHAEIHNNYCPHGNWFFLPWHRAYLHHFELVCREFCGDQSFSLPYWDWSSDARLPEEFDSGTEATNPLCNDTRSIKNRAALQVEEVSETRVKAILATLDFQEFAGAPSHHPRPKLQSDKKGYRGTLEAGPHNKVHATIQGDMGAFISPRDPIFWLHHCNVDRLWEIWRAQVVLNKGEPLPSEVRKADGSVDAAADVLFPGRGYWKDHALDGFYSITKNGEAFTAEPASMKVSAVLEASALGLVYYSPETPVAPVAKAAEVVAQGEVAPPPTIDPSTTIVPTAQSKSLAVSRWKKAIQKTVLIRTKAVKSFGLTTTGPGSVTLEGSAELEQVLKSAAAKQWNTASLRLKIDGIPTPSDMGAELHFYLNATETKDKRSNPSFIGAMSFFGHDHEPGGIGVIFNLAPTLKTMLAAGRAPFGQGKPQDLTVAAVWDRSSVKGDLSQLTLSLDYLEHVA